MTCFFVPQRAQDDAERAYQALREQAELCTGAVARDRRIQAVECRYRGVDRHVCVGEADATNGKVVEAILQVGRDTYTIHHLQPQDAEHGAPTVLQRTDVYAITDFE
ncbi:MAG: hypothetical protein E6G34_05770 [Actinobacteria bacterium]|nr:MAG: hypothetical protein E6G34_05770 [Actinomycetota bacterium]